MENIVKPSNKPKPPLGGYWDNAKKLAHIAYVQDVEKNLQGQVFGFLTFKGYAGERYENQHEKWLFDCVCGRKDVPRNLSYVLGGRIKSCGCKMNFKPRKQVKDLLGQKFGKLTVISRINSYPVKWQCTCDCGNKVEIRQHDLTKGRTTHCGCENPYKDDRRVIVKIGVTEMALTDWAKVIGVSRQRAHQLYKKGFLQGRVEALTS